MPYIGNVLTSFAVETGNINDQAVTAPKLSATGGTNGQVLALDAGGNLVWTSDPAGQWVTIGSDIYYDTGLVGIGTSSPSVNLQVNAASDVSIALSNSSSVTSGNRGSISMYNSAISTVGLIRFAAVTDNVGTEIQFYTRPAAGSLTQTMTLDSAGRLGIGVTASGANLLQVNSDALINGITIGRGLASISSNTAVGSGALAANTTGTNNVANGYQALYLNTTGAFNTAIGTSTLSNNTTADSNTAVGQGALYSNTGAQNTALGRSTLSNNTTGSNNTAIGNDALILNTTGGSNCCLGYDSGSALTTGSNNTIIGSIAGTAGLADTVIIAAGATERLRIDSSGRVGIGTSAPASTLHIQHAAQTASYWEGKGLLIHEDATANKGIALYSRGDNEQYIASLTDDAASYLIIGTRKSSSVNAVDAVTIRGDGKVGIGTTSPRRTLEVSGADGYLCLNATNTSTGTSQLLFGDTDDDNIGRIYYDHGTDNMAFWTNTSEKARIDTSGRLLVGTSSSAAGGSRLQIEGTGYYESSASFRRNSNDASAPALRLNKSRGTSTGSYTAVQNGDVLGLVQFSGSDGTDDETGAQIACEVDGTPGANDMPGRLVFSTTADGASSPTERMRINSGGFLSASDNGSFTYAGSHHSLLCSNNESYVRIASTNGSYTGLGALFGVAKSANSDYSIARMYSGNGSDPFGDVEFQFRGDGNAFADGTWTGGGADYAEFFEWSDSNPAAEDRRGISVVLDGDKIREAVTGEDPIGVISGNPSVVGDAAWNKWNGKYLRDEFGTYIQEDYKMTDEDGNTVTQQRRKLNPAYDPDVDYVSREQRPEWDCVGLMGKLRIRKGQVTGSRWIKMRDISATVEEWLVR
jgi:hypothetical protein